jgi:nitrous oxidase accessory protein NosD
MGSSLRVLLVGLAVAGLLAFAGPARAATIHVQPGQSIQAAIDAAEPGDRIVVEPGVYHENLTITKDNLTLRGAGLDEERTVLEPGETPTPSICTQADVVHGICVTGPSPGPPVTGTTIRGFTIAHFSGFGIFLLNANDSVVRQTQARDNDGYGISGFVLSGVRFIDNIANDNGQPGLYIGDSPDANAVVRGNESYGNGAGGAEGDGILIRDSNHGVVRGNRVWDNCVGITFVDSGENLDVALSDWQAENNWAARNNRSCLGEEGGAPPLSGIGILLLGTDDVLVRRNTVVGNEPTGPSIASAGIALLSGIPAGGAEPTNTRVEQNRVHDNDPYDILWDESGSANTFNNNDCEKSLPSWICS